MREGFGRTALCVLAVALSAAAPVAAVTWTVDVTADQLLGSCSPGDCSLRDAIALASPGDDIDFSLPGSPPWTIRLDSGLGQLVVAQALTITGPATSDLVVSGDTDGDGTGDLRVLRVHATGDLTMSGLTVADGRATSAVDRDGGCIQNAGVLTLDSVRLTNCLAWDGALFFTGSPGGDGGAIWNAATASLTMDLSILDGNRAGTGDINNDGTQGANGGRGGALANLGAATIRTSTLSGNAAGDGGQPNGSGGEGGGIANLAGGTLLLDDSTVAGNHSGDGRNSPGADGRGGGMFLEGDSTLNDDTVSGNQTGILPGSGSSVGGGGMNVFGGTTRLRNVTVTANVSRGGGGGVSRAGGTVRLANSIVAANTSVNFTNEDCFTGSPGDFVSEGYNLVGVQDGCASSLVASDQRGTSASPLDPMVYPLDDYGGPTPTHSLQAGSPAIDLGNPGGCLAWDPVQNLDVLLTDDQRGFFRPEDGDGDTVAVCDVGSFEAPPPGPEQHLLSVALAGSGSGSVTSSPPGVSCPGDCSELYLATDTVDLTATLAPGSLFAGWSGDCTGTGTCSFDMSVDRSVTATFEQPYTLTVAVTGTGTVASSPPGISCPGDCTEDYADGTPVTLTATPGGGWVFAGWTGDCSGRGDCVVTMTADHSVGATFTQPQTWTVDVTADQLLGTCLPGNCSLRDAIALASDSDQIDFALPGSPPWTIRLDSGLGQLVVDQVLTITGPGTTDLVVSGDSDGNGTGDLRVLRVEAAGDLAVSGLSLADGRAASAGDRHGGCVQNLGALTLDSVHLDHCAAWDGDDAGSSGAAGGDGGAIWNAAGASLTVDLSSFAGNHAGQGDGGSPAGKGGRGGALANFGAATIRTSTLSGNTAGDGGAPNGAGGEGGGIANLAGGTLLLEDSTVANSRSGDGRNGSALDGRGGGLFLEGNSTLNDDTVSGNRTGALPGTGGAAGGGGMNVFGGTTRLRNVTVAGNTSLGGGGGVSRAGGTVRLANSIVAANTSVNFTNEDCFTGAAANFVSEGYNLVGAQDGCASSLVATDQHGTSASPLDPRIYPLDDYGGPTPTHSLQAGSPAIDLGNPGGCLAWDPVQNLDVLLTDDQRGFFRPEDGDGDTVAVCDVGSFEAPPPGPEQHLLSVALAGNGSGTVTSAPPGISCPGDCSQVFLATDTVDLTATPAPGSLFAGWSGDCTGTGACSVDMTADRNVTATFGLPHTLTVTVTGTGTVASSPPGISCPGDCTEDYVDGTPVTLTATPGGGWVFAGWTGDCSGRGDCVVTMTADRNVDATFSQPQTWTVDVTADQLLGSCTPGNCSLRDAIAAAASGDLVDFALPGSPPWTIRLDSGLGQLVVAQALTISGPGTTDLVVSGDSDGDGTGDLRVLRVEAAGDLLVGDLTIADGRATSAGDRHGGCVQNLGALTLDSVHFDHCAAWDGDDAGSSGVAGGDGGAIYNDTGASLTAALSSFAANHAGQGDGGSPAGKGGRGGALANLGAATIRTSTLSGNAAGDGGATNGAGGEGGGIANLAGGTLLLEDSTVAGNHSGDGRGGSALDGRGGGLFLQGEATLNDDTVSGNQTGVDPASGAAAGGGGMNVFGGTTRLRNVTVADNSSLGGGGGVSRAGGTVRLANSIVATNTSVNFPQEDCFTGAAANFVSEGYNLIGAQDGCASSLVATDQRGTSGSPLDPRLSPLADNGGPTETHALAGGSPAIDLGNPGGCLAWDPVQNMDVLFTDDQRGFTRPVDGDGDGNAVCDVGSFESDFVDTMPFIDGFETGDTSRWSFTIP